jgi:hypothetical protein
MCITAATAAVVKKSLHMALKTMSHEPRIIELSSHSTSQVTVYSHVKVSESPFPWRSSDDKAQSRASAAGQRIVGKSINLLDPYDPRLNNITGV